LYGTSRSHTKGLFIIPPEKDIVFFGRKACATLQRIRFAHTFARREVFFATYTPRQKTIELCFAAAAAKCKRHPMRSPLLQRGMDRFLHPKNISASVRQGGGAVVRSVGFYKRA